MTELRCNLHGPTAEPNPGMMTVELRGPLTPFITLSAQVHKGSRGNPPLGKSPIPPGPDVTHPLPSAQSSGGASLKQVLPSSSQSMLAPTGGLWSLRKRARLRAEASSGWGRASSARCPFPVPGNRQPTPKGPSRPYRRVQLQWKRGSRALLNSWNLVFWGPIWCSHWSRRRKLRQAWRAPGGRCGGERSPVRCPLPSSTHAQSHTHSVPPSHALCAFRVLHT